MRHQGCGGRIVEGKPPTCEKCWTEWPTLVQWVREERPAEGVEETKTKCSMGAYRPSGHREYH